MILEAIKWINLNDRFGEAVDIVNYLEDLYKHRQDVLNWAKSELKSEEKSKLGKTMHPYRTEKIKFLRTLIKRYDN